MMPAKEKKIISVLFTFFFLIFLLSSGEGTPWGEMLLGSGLYSLVMTSLAFLLVQVIRFLTGAIHHFNSDRQ